MHPLIARLHPAVRTGLVAWLISRSALWLLSTHRPADLATGSPLPGLVDTALDSLNSSIGSETAATLVGTAPWIAVEILILIAGIGVYRFARTTGLPRLAERACWLWFFNPVLAMTATDWGAQLAAATGAIALAAVVTARPLRGVAAAVVAIGCRLEFVLLWPALAVAAWRHHCPKRHSPATLALTVTAMPVAFTAWIALSWHLAGSADTSLRLIHNGASWRAASELIPAAPHQLIWAVGLIGALIVAIRYLKRFPVWYLLAALPLLVWPLVQVPVYFAAITTAWALPTFVHLAVATDDRNVERALLAGLVVAFLLIAHGG